MMDALKPCPFCGGEAKVAIGQGQHDGHGYIVFCDRCWVSQSYLDKTEAEAIEAWNTRAERTCRNNDTDNDDFFQCSECGSSSVTEFLRGGYGIPTYCPNCGAKVVGE